MSIVVLVYLLGGAGYVGYLIGSQDLQPSSGLLAALVGAIITGVVWLPVLLWAEAGARGDVRRSGVEDEPWERGL